MEIIFIFLPFIILIIATVTIVKKMQNENKNNESQEQSKKIMSDKDFEVFDLTPKPTKKSFGEKMTSGLSAPVKSSHIENLRTVDFKKSRTNYLNNGYQCVNFSKFKDDKDSFKSIQLPKPSNPTGLSSTESIINFGNEENSFDLDASDNRQMVINAIVLGELFNNPAFKRKRNK